jgi:molybdopterin synthase sulfur carrier subunit
MTIQIRYFASLREALGPGESWSGPDAAAGAPSVATVRDALIARGGRYAEVLARGRAVRCAVNQTLVDEAAAVPDGAELAFFPPVTGG